MRSRAIPALVGVAALALATALTGTASAQGSSGITTSSGSVSSVEAPTSAVKPCKGANYVGTSNGNVTAQDFEEAYEIYSSMGGQAFQATAKKCKIKSVYVEGSGPAAPTTLRVWIYKQQANGLPDKSKEVCATTADATGPIYTVPFKCTLKKGKYAFVAQVDQNFGTYGQWFWNTMDAGGTPTSSWKNPGGGFGTPCTDWSDLLSCLGYNGNFIFSLRKNAA